MKKGLLLLGAAALCTTAFAQQEAGWLTANNEEAAKVWGWDAATETWQPKGKEADGNAKYVDAGGLIAESKNVVLKTTFYDNAGASGINKLGLKAYVVNGTEYVKESVANDAFEGAVGNTNPSAIADLNPDGIVINKGWVFDYEVKANGWLTVFNAPSMNKNLYVVEGTMGEGQVVANGAVAYEIYLEGKDAIAGLEGTSFSFKLPANEEGYLNLNAADIDKYVSNGCIAWPYKILIGDAAMSDADAKEAAGNSFGSWNGAMVFPVYEGCHYYVFATGSKLTGGPYVWTQEKPTQVAFTKEIKDEEGNVTDVKVMNLIGEYTPAAVEAVEAVENADAPVYNMMGIRVNSEAKGILIQNGKKFIRK